MQRFWYTRGGCWCVSSRIACLQMEMREMRQGALKVIQRSKREAEQQQQEVTRTWSRMHRTIPGQ